MLHFGTLFIRARWILNQLKKDPLINESDEEIVKLCYFYIYYELDPKLFNFDFYIHRYSVW